jgi:hypothetical protein
MIDGSYLLDADTYSYMHTCKYMTYKKVDLALFYMVYNSSRVRKRHEIHPSLVQPASCSVAIVLICTYVLSIVHIPIPGSSVDILPDLEEI